MKRQKIFFIILFLFVFGQAHSNDKKINDLSIIPKNVFEAISLVQERHEIFRINNEKKTDFFLSEYSGQFNLFSFARNISKSFNNLEAINAKLPNLTEACNLQALAFSVAIYQKQRWSLSGNVSVS
jgi:hypothetical protein